MFRRKSTSVLLSTAVVFGMLALPQLAFASDDNSSETETESPSPTATYTPRSPKPERTEHADSPLQQQVEDDDHSGPGGSPDIEAHEESHDISTPPLLIRPESPTGKTGLSGSSSLGGSTKDKVPGFYTAPLGFYLEKSFSDTDLDNNTDGVSKFNAEANPPVIENIVYTPFATPADEFMSRSYVGIGVLAIGAGTMLTVVLRRNRSKHEDLA